MNKFVVAIGIAVIAGFLVAANTGCTTLEPASQPKPRAKLDPETEAWLSTPFGITRGMFFPFPRQHSVDSSRQRNE